MVLKYDKEHLIFAISILQKSFLLPKTCYKAYFFDINICVYEKSAVLLHRVFHGIRFKVK